MKSRFTLAVCALSLATGAALIIRAEASGSVRPVTINYSEASYPLTQGQQPKRVVSETMGVRSDGSVALARLMSNKVAASQPAPVFNIRIVDVPHNRYLVVDQFTESVTTYPSEQMVAAREIHPSSACAGAAGPRLLGYSTVLEETTTPNPAITLTARYWRSPELDCLPLRVEKEVRHANGLGGLTIRTATAVTLGDPPAWMFTVPANFKERTPGEVLSEAAIREQGASCPLPGALDQAYRAAQTRKTHQ